jgi:hypothetical protein
VPDGFTRKFQFYIPNLDFRFWPTDSRRTPTWGGLDRLRDAKKMAASGKGRARQSASNLVKGEITGNFNVVRGAPQSYVEDEFGDAVAESPGPPVLYFPEDVDILEHLAEAAMDAMERQQQSTSAADNNFSARSSDGGGGSSGGGARASSSDGGSSGGGGGGGGKQQHNGSSSNNNSSSSSSKPVVKLVVLGDNATVHRFVLAFFSFQRINPALFESVRMQVDIQ